jgi:predicted phage replisome organizer
MKVNWLKLDINILNDEKIRMIRKYPDGDKLFILWVGLLCLAMKSEIKGHILICEGSPYSPDDIANILEIEIKTVIMGLELFSRFGMVEVSEFNEICLVKFREHQSIDKIENMEKAQEKNRLRVQRFREKKKNLKLESKTDSKSNKKTCNVTVMECNDADKNRSDKNRSDKKREYATGVFLTEKEYNSLTDKYKKSIVIDYIDRVSEYQISKPRTYKDHKKTIINWFKKDGIQPMTPSEKITQEKNSIPYPT